MNERIKLLLFSALLAIGLFATYSNHWHNDFHFDDSHTVQSNVYIQSLSNIPLFFKDPVTFSSIQSHCSYRPLVSTTLAIDYYMGKGLDPFYFHISTFFFFVLQGVLMFFFFVKMLDAVSGNTPNRFIALFATGLYMLHPALAETINYIISRSDTLSTVFVVMAFVVYQYSAVARKYYLYLIPVLIGALAKPTAIMFAPMLVVYHILFDQKKDLLSFIILDWKKLLLVTLPGFALAIGVYLFIKHKEAGYFEAGGYSFYHYFITQPFIYVHYVSQFLLPTKLSADTDWGTFEKLSDPRAIAGFIFLGSMVFSIFYLSRFEKWRPLVFGLAWFLLALVPTSLVPLAEVMNDHRVFYPYVGLAIALVWTAYLLLQGYIKQIPAPVLTAVLVLILYGYAQGTYTRNIVWKTEENLWNDVSIKSPKNGRGLMNYGLVFMGRASYDTANYYFTKALEFCPRYSLLHINMAVLKNAMGDKRAAEEYFKNGITYGNEAGNYYFYARWLKDNGRKDEAIDNLYKSIRLVDARMDARAMLIPLLYERQRYEELRTVATRTLELAPGDANATTYLQMANSGKSRLQIEEEASAKYTTADQFLNLSLLYYNAGDYQGCINAANKALGINPNFAEAYNNICSAYNALNKFEEGAKACEAALRIKPGYPLAQGNLNYAKKMLKK